MDFFRVNFKKLRPRAPLIKESKVFQELQKEAIAEPAQVQELKRTTTFLQKPERPVPKPKSALVEENSSAESQETYKVVIKKQPKKSITERLLEKGLLEPGCIKTPEPGSEVKMYVPSRVAEAEAKQVASESTNFKETTEPTNIVNTIEPTNFVGTNESTNVLEFTEEKFVLKSTEPKSIPHSARYTEFVESAKHTLDSDIPSVLTMDRCGLNMRRPKKLYMRNRYFENCVLRKKPSSDKKKGVRSVRLYRKGHYFNKIIHSFTGKYPNKKIESTTKPIRSAGRSFKFQVRGHYAEKNLVKNGSWVIESAKGSVQSLLSSPKVSSSPIKLRRKGRYAKRILSQYVNSTKLFLNPASSSSTTSISQPSSNSNFISSVKDSISNEIFHRGCKRFWSEYRTDFGWFEWIKNLSGISFKVTKKAQSVPVAGQIACKEKALNVDNANDTRRLSFVPTIIYDELTNRIGVEFTRVVVYAFVPCASVVLLYAYK